MNRWIGVGVGAVAIAVAAVVVKGCDSKSTSSKTGKGSSTESPSDGKGAKNQMADLFGQKPGEGGLSAEVPKPKFNAVAPELLAQASMIVGVQPTERAMDLVLLDAAGKRLGNLTSDGLPKLQASLSRDHNWITFVCAPEVKPPRWDVYVASLDGKTVRCLTEDFPPQSELVESRNQGRGAKTRNNLSPTFTPDGQHVVYTTSIIAQPRNIVWQPRDGGARKTFTSAEAKEDILKFSAPDCSPSGETVVFTRRAKRNTQSIWSMDLQSGQEKEIVATESALLDNPLWSPDGKQIAFTERAERYNRFYLHVVNADGTNDRKLNDKESVESDAFAFSWSADGTKLLFSKKIDKQEDLHSIEIATSTIARITNTPDSEITPLSLR